SPTNSSIQFDAIIPFSYLQSMFTDKNWLNQYLTTFILLRPDADVRLVEQKFANVFTANAKDQLIDAGATENQFQFSLSPVSDLHLNPMPISGYGSADEERGLSNSSSPSYSYILAAVISFIVMMACINFINLNIAASLKRSKEIGIRKIVGGSKKN